MSCKIQWLSNNRFFIQANKPLASKQQLGVLPSLSQPSKSNEMAEGNNQIIQRCSCFSCISLFSVV